VHRAGRAGRAGVGAGAAAAPPPPPLPSFPLPAGARVAGSWWAQHAQGRIRIACASPFVVGAGVWV
jgi:hypothetical protein